MKILIIGNRGFIGSFISNALFANNKVWGCDTVHASEPNYYRVSIDLPDYNSIFRVEKFDLCINCAGLADVQNSIKNPLTDFNSNLVNLAILLDTLIKENPRCKVINISSAAVYGNPTQLPISTDHKANPISPYGVHKMLAEKLMSEYSKIYGINTCSVRIFSAYGNGQRKLFLWDCFHKLSSIGTDQKVFFFGTGRESRDFIHITDIIEQIKLVIHNAAFEGEVYNIANGEEIFIKDVVATMQNAMNNAVKVVFSGEARPGDPINWRADITPMLNWGYRKSISMEDGIKEYVKWVSENA